MKAWGNEAITDDRASQYGDLVRVTGKDSRTLVA